MLTGMNKQHIPFPRRFASPSEEMLRDPDYLSIWGHTLDKTHKWEDLLSEQCVVILGEGKSGKTHEFRQRVKELRSSGKVAVFLPLELLHENDVKEVLGVDDELALEGWLQSESEEAYVFLDAVDELKLRKGSFRAALRKLRRFFGSNCNRVRLSVSCRPRDWDKEIDLEELKPWLIEYEEEQKEAELNGEHYRSEDVFLAAVKNADDLDDRNNERTKQEIESAVKVLALLPLSRDEIIEFASMYRPRQANQLKDIFEKNELWHLYQAPADIIDALDQLHRDGKLGNLEAQLEFGIENKLDEVSDNKRNNISIEKAREGAERIALALFLLKKRSVRLDAKSDGLNASEILVDWTRTDVEELLGRPVFDPTGVGAVRFHHRSTQEFLAAKRLQHLAKNGLARSDLYGLLFGKVGSEQVTIPSMEPVTAWLALWDRDVLQKVKERKPSLLFREGLPASMSIGLRADLLRRYVELYANSEWRRVGIGHQELKRIASPELEPVVRELWSKAYTGHDTREILLELIWFTPLKSCVDLAFRAAFDEELPTHHRSYACWAVLQNGTLEQKTTLGGSIVNNYWPEQVVRSTMPDLLPTAVSDLDFFALSLAQKETPKSVHGLGYALYQTMKSPDLSSKTKIELRNCFTKAVWLNRKLVTQVYQAHSAFDHFTDAILASCYSLQPQTDVEIADWAWSACIAFHFGERRSSIIAKDEVEGITKVIDGNLAYREAFYWACFHFVEQIEGPDDDWGRFVRIDYDRIIRPFEQKDFNWLLNALGDKSKNERRGVAFYTLSHFIRDGENPELLNKIRASISDRLDLLEELEKILNPPIREPDRYEISHRKRQKKWRKKENKRVKQWQKWRNEVLSDPEFLLARKERERTIYDVYNLLRQHAEKLSSWADWNAKFIEEAFSSEFLSKLRNELGQFWRSNDVELWSERPEDKRGTYSNSWLLALTAVKCEAETTGWTSKLSDNEARLATRISMVELNGFASFLAALEASHPDVVHDLISKEVKAQLESIEQNASAPLLHDVYYHSSNDTKRSVAQVIAKTIGSLNKNLPNQIRNEVEYAVKIVSQNGSPSDKCLTLKAVKKQMVTCETTSIDEEAYWINLLSKLDLRQACSELLKRTETLNGLHEFDQAVTLFASMFGDRGNDARSNFDELPISERIGILKRLVIRAYNTVLLRDDIHHDGVFTPGRREHAEEARGYLFSTLIETKSPQTLSILYEFSGMPEFSHMKDRLKQIATELAEQICEPDPMPLAIYRQFDQEQSYLPYDNRSLFAVMNNRLADFEHHLLEDEFSTVDTLKKINGETELRRFISNWLNQNNRGAYTITQEAVKVNEKRTDIRLQPNNGDYHASIELKLDGKGLDRWSGADLKRALLDQLVGKYLSHQRCQVGCLLICMPEPRKWENPDTKEVMSLLETVHWLQTLANALMEENPDFWVSVKGIDYSSNKQSG